MASEESPEPRVDAIAHGLDAEQVRDLLRRDLDFGCRPQLQRADDGTYALLVIGTQGQLEALRRDGFELSALPQAERDAYAVGVGDRFAAGDAVPRGFGEKLSEPTHRTDLL
jgi:hypothetical protein